MVDTCRLHHERLGGIGEDEAILIRPVSAILARTALAVGFQERGEDVHSFLSCPASLESQTEQIHPDQAWLSPELVREQRGHSLVAADHASFVCADLTAPHPGGFGEDNRIRVLGLWDGYVRAPEHSTRLRRRASTRGTLG